MGSNNHPMKRSIYLIIILLIIAAAGSYWWMGRYRPIEQLEIPGIPALTTSLAEVSGSGAPGVQVMYKGFTLSFNNQTHQANWVAYELTREEVEQRRAERKDRFRRDTLAGLVTASSRDYTRSGYDRGHLAPAADMAWDQEAMDQSFFFSNIAPQTPGLNRGIWKRLEDDGREWAQTHESLYIIAGPLFRSPVDTIGILPVPDGFFKAFLVYQRSSQQALAFVFPNTPEVPGNLADYVLPVDSLEMLTGTDWFDRLPDRIERRVERTVDLSFWQLR